MILIIFQIISGWSPPFSFFFFFLLFWWGKKVFWCRRFRAFSEKKTTSSKENPSLNSPKKQGKNKQKNSHTTEASALLVKEEVSRVSERKVGRRKRRKRREKKKKSNLGWFFLTWRWRRKRRKINEKRKKNAQETGMTSSAIPNGYKLWVIVGRLGGDSGAASQGQRRWWRKCLVVTSWGTCRGITVLLCPCPLGIVWARLKGHRVGQGSERHVSVPSEVSFFSIFVFQRLWPSSLPFIECHLCRLRCIFTSCNKGWWKNSRLASLGGIWPNRTLKSLVHSGRHRSQLGVNLAGRASHDQAHQGVLGNLDVLVCPQDVNMPK